MRKEDGKRSCAGTQQKGGDEMTQWQTRRELVTKNLTMHRVFRIVDG